MRSTDKKQNKRYFRSSERVFRMNEAWYFAAREGDQGPFSCESEAFNEMSRFSVEKVELAGFQEKREVVKARVTGLELIPLDSRIRRRPQAAMPINRPVMI